MWGNSAYSRIFQNNTSPSQEDVVGAVSCIVWALTLVPLTKYCWIVLRAGDDQGEGFSHLRDNLTDYRRDVRLVYAFESISQSRQTFASKSRRLTLTHCHGDYRFYY